MIGLTILMKLQMHRHFDKNEKAKYINSPETKIYNKSKLLYGLHETKNEISSQDSAVISLNS